MKTIYMTMRNADMTEGRGPMVQDLCFSGRELAAEYIDQQPGVMGRRGKWSEDKFGDWKIQTLEVLDQIPDPNQKNSREGTF